MSEINPEVAVRYYKAHLKAVSEYQLRNPDKMRAKANNYNAKIKATNPAKYEANLAKKKAYYDTVRKPKIAAAKAAALAEPQNEIVQVDSNELK